AGDVMQTYVAGYLQAGLGVQGARGYLLDGHGKVMAASTGKGVAARLADRRLLAAMRAHSAGALSGQRFASAPVAGTHWRVLFVAGEAPLLASIEGANKRASELLFLAFVTVLALTIVLAVRMMGRSAQ